MGTRFAQAVDLPTSSAEAALDDALERTERLADRLGDGALAFPQRPTADWIAQVRHRRSRASDV